MWTELHVQLTETVAESQNFPPQMTGLQLARSHQTVDLTDIIMEFKMIYSWAMTFNFKIS